MTMNRSISMALVLAAGACGGAPAADAQSTRHSTDAHENRAVPNREGLEQRDRVRPADRSSTGTPQGKPGK